jgi:hypothetical protein
LAEIEYRAKSADGRSQTDSICDQTLSVWELSPFVRTAYKYAN